MNQIASLEVVTIRDSYLVRGNYSDAREALLHASVVTRCQPFKMPRPIVCVCARSSLSRLDALSRKLHYLESLGPFSRRRQPRALGSLNGVVSSTSASNVYLKGTD